MSTGTFYERHKKKIKAGAIAAGGGALGAGLDLALGGHTALDDYFKPMLAWGAGGLAGSMTGGEEAKDASDDKSEDK